MASLHILPVSRWGCVLAMVASVAMVCPVRSVDEPIPEKGSIANLIHRLGDQSFRVREAASAELSKRGEEARKQLQEAARQGTDPETRRRADSLLRQLDASRRQASGIHVIGLYEAASPHFRLLTSGEDIDWARIFAAVVRQGQDETLTPGKRIWTLLPGDMRTMIADENQVKSIVAAAATVRAGGPIQPEAHFALNKVSRSFEDVLRRADFYEEKFFTRIALDEESKGLEKRHKELSLLESWVFNRRLLEASFPDAVKKTPVSLSELTVPVRITATKEPITLVLCSYEYVRWQIQEDKGAKLAKVIVGGYHLQAVTGTTAPITYRVYEDPKSVTKEPRYFFAYKQDQEYYPRLVDAVHRLTGQGIATFQGRYQFKGGTPFVVGDQ